MFTCYCQDNKWKHLTHTNTTNCDWCFKCKHLFSKYFSPEKFLLKYVTPEVLCDFPFSKHQSSLINSLIYFRHKYTLNRRFASSSHRWSLSPPSGHMTTWTNGNFSNVLPFYSWTNKVNKNLLCNIWREKFRGKRILQIIYTEQNLKKTQEL